MTKKGPFFWSSNVKKAGAQKWASPVQASTRFFFLTGALCLSAGRGTWDLFVYHVTIAAPYLGGIDPRLTVYARSWDGHYTKSASTQSKRFNRAKTGPSRGDHVWFQAGRSTFWLLFKHVSYAWGSKTGPFWIRCLLGGPLLNPPKQLQLRCSISKLAIRASNKGGSKLGHASPSLEAPRLQALETRNLFH